MGAAVRRLKCDGMSPAEPPGRAPPPPKRRPSRQRLRQAALAQVSACLEAFERGDRKRAARHALAAGRALLLLALQAPRNDRR